ncbi:flotillin family protein [Symbiobacterium thermophilum]|uniref:Flotillin n=1 Tax=Symbiobacterium thermophilum TaxID=2734 RepID=A0A953LJL2_SYMTR|nr:flotillin family protein [Symbiobacterium thermophilum]MBY6275992.1 flotillin [Symbiobacterium thermophilum]
MGPLIIAGLTILGILLLLGLLASMYRKVPPNRALIVYGFGGPRVTKGGGLVVWPLIQSAQELSLELMSFDVVPQQDFYTVQGVAVTVEAVAQIKVKSDTESILTAAEQFLSKTTKEQNEILKLVMEGHLRGIIGQLTVEQIVKEPEMVADRMRANVADDMSKMGLEVISFTIKEIKDKNDYINNMGRPDTERIKRAAEIAAAEALRDTEIKRAEAMREAAIAKARAEQETVLAQSESLAKQAEAQRDLNLKKAAFEAEVKRAQAQADKAYDIEANIIQQKVVAEQVRVQQVERQEQVKVQEAEILRREKELIATVLKAAEIERQKQEALAAAQARKLEIEAEGQARAIRLSGEAEADVVRQKGLAEAEVILAKGRAEAEAMRIKAEAYKEYGQAAILDKLMPVLPELMRAAAEPLSRIDKVTILSQGQGAEVGVNKFMADVAKLVATAPTVLEGLTGISIQEMMKQLPGLESKVREIEAEVREAEPVPQTEPAPVAAAMEPEAEAEAEGKTKAEA